jgi:hypothetical protein
MLAEKLGFRCEGLLLATLRVEDIWHDEMLYLSSGPTASANSLWQLQGPRSVLLRRVPMSTLFEADRSIDLAKVP